jgi:hypothetical protein
MRLLNRILSLVVFCCLAGTSLSQKIVNVDYEISGTDIHIYYDLSEVAEGQPVIIRVYVSTDGGQSFGEPLKRVTGDVGVVLGPGKRRKIIWDVFAEVDELVSESVQFKVKADPLQSDAGSSQLKPAYVFNLNVNLGSKVKLNSYGFGLKGAIYLKQLGMGLRGIYYKTFEADPGNIDFNAYMGFAGGVILEYDFIRDPRYSLYPFLYVGQTKIEYQDSSIPNEYSGYSIFYTPGLGLDIKIAKFIYLGIELEYYMAPVVDINDQGSSSVVDRIVLDGFCGGFSLKFMINQENR